MEPKKSPGFRLREIFAALAGRDSTDEIASIENAMSRLEAERLAAQTDLALLAEQRVQALLDDDDDACDRLDRRSEAMHRVCERVEVALPELQQRLADARKRSDEAARQASYASAQEAIRHARAALNAYPEAAQQIVGILETVAKADVAVAAANSALPEGRTALDYVEHAVRGWPADAREEVVGVSDERVWQVIPTGWMIDAADVKDIKSTDGVHGTIEKDFGGGLRPYSVVRRIRRTESVLRARSAVSVESLSTEISLPPLTCGGVPFWAPTGVGSMYGPPDGGAILATINQRRDHLHERPQDPRPGRVTDIRTRIIEDGAP